ncbi:PPPDE_putative peptidase domain-containing protein [Hexamita inflata]|uniref:PPPDE_putative peptidase domain-containing protein n=1 Tax=Hexamita inflata TaxID=28002 RepID=A0ABP1LPV3_9EUKA
MKCSSKTIILTPNKSKLKIDQKQITFVQDDKREFYNFDHCFTKPKQFQNYFEEQLDASDETDHLLFVFLSNSEELASQDEFFTTLLNQCGDTYSFLVNGFDDVQYAQHYTSGGALLQERVVRYPYYLRVLHNLARITIVYINSEKTLTNPSPLAIFLANCKNIMFQSTKDPLFSQINKIYFLIDIQNQQQDKHAAYYLKRLYELQQKVKGEMILFRKIRNKQETAEVFNIRHLTLIPFQIFQQKTLNTRSYLENFNKIQKLCIQFHTFKLMNEAYAIANDIQSEKEIFFDDNRRYNEIKKYILYTQQKLKETITTPKSIESISFSRSLRKPQLIESPPPAINPISIELFEKIQKKYKNFSKFTQLLLKELKPIILSELQPPYPVYLNVYNLLSTKALTNMGIGFFHSAVEIMGVEVAFGGHNYDETGVYAIKPRSLGGASFYKQCYIEHTFLSKEQICEIFLESAINWRGNMYDILHYNCNDFTNQLCMKLVGVPIPSFVNRAATIGRVFKKKKTKVTGDLGGVVAFQGELVQEDEQKTKKKSGREAMFE